jgi:hypothetical protein
MLCYIMLLSVFFLRFLRGFLKKFKRLLLLGRALHVPKCPSFFSLFFSFLFFSFGPLSYLSFTHWLSRKKKKAKRKNQSKYLALVAGFFYWNAHFKRNFGVALDSVSCAPLFPSKACGVGGFYVGAFTTRHIICHLSEW